MKAGVVLCLSILSGITLADQALVDYLAQNLTVHYKVITNFVASPETNTEVTLTNVGEQDAAGTTWEIFFCSVRMWEPDSLKDNPDVGVLLGDSKIMVFHLNGCLHKLAPAENFPGFVSGEPVVLPTHTSDWTVSRTDISPNWYVSAPDADSKTLISTEGESLGFVADFTLPQQWKRTDYDEYNPYTAEDRYELFEDTDDTGNAQIPIIPTPSQYQLHSENTINIRTEGWVVYSVSEETANAAQLLADKLGIEVVDSQPASQYIKLEIGEITDTEGEVVDIAEAYRINVHVDDEYIDITGQDSAGGIYGAQSIISLDVGGEGAIPDATVVDWPRFHYRGFMPDVSRNFLPKDDIIRLLEAMAMYKLNKFHFHLSDDEGWRLEIPGLKELHEIGGKRCDDLEELTCIISQLGSGPGSSNSGSGFYTREEYIEILRYANDRAIELIPEFDMPGHGHAPIKAMQARYNLTGDQNYLLHDIDDGSTYVSIQFFRDNAINPCIESTYNFVRKVVEEIKAMHEDIQPLKVFHFGGDEVPHGAWVGSPECSDFNMTPEELKEYFVHRVSNITHEEGLDLAGWEDGLMSEDNDPYQRESFPNTDVYGYAWNNIWEWGGGSRAYILANHDYKVILSHATEFYFDMPYEPDPEDRGFYWATRFTETRNVFNYMPDRVYDNMEVDLFGRELDQDEVCNRVGCVPLEEGKESNIVGMAGQLWSETVRTPEQFFEMVFPRLIAIAERSWHKADWESTQDNDDRKLARGQDWEDFANTLGYRELARLDEIGVTYKIPPPGAKFEAGELVAGTSVPGLTIQYSTDNGDSWQDYESGVQIPSDTEVLLRARSADEARTSRVISTGSWTNTTPDTSGAKCLVASAFCTLAALWSILTL